MNPPLVSVVMITYNHELYIEEAISSILMQGCDFEVELIIANDKSTDATQNVIENYLRNNIIPTQITVRKYHHQSNKGMMGNFVWALEKTKGKYVALCEGDDYWTDPLKLKKQVDFLEVNPKFSMCGAQAKCLIVMRNEKEFSGGFLGNNKSILNTKDFLKGYPMHTSTVLFRRNMLQLPEWINEVKNGDITLFSILSEKGPSHFINEIVSVYRITGTGVWSSASLETRYYAFKNTVNHLNRHFKGRYKKVQYQWEFKEAQKVAKQLLSDKSYGRYLGFILKNYHRYFWSFILVPKSKKIIFKIKGSFLKFFIKFRMYVGLRTRLKNLRNKLSKQNEP